MYRKAAIVGIGQTEMVRHSQRSEWDLALSAIVEALRDAEIAAAEVDGIVRFGYDNVSEPMLVRSLGIRELRYYGEIGYGSLATCAVVSHAAGAIASGQASVVIAFRAVNQSVGVRYGRAERHLQVQGDRAIAAGPKAPGGELSAPYGLLAPGQAYAIAARRYQFENKLGEDELSDALGAIAITQRAYAQNNPGAMTRGRPLTMDDYRNGRMIAAPLRIHDYCMESVGAAALILVGSDRATAAPQPPAYVLSADQSMTAYSEPTPLYMKSLTQLAPAAARRRLFGDARIQPSDLAAAQLYDAFTFLALLQVESYGLAGPGDGWKYLLEQGIGLDSPVPVNTHGGLLSEGYLHGMNHLTEAVRQIRGTAANQVAGDGPVLVGGHMMSSVILGR